MVLKILQIQGNCKGKLGKVDGQTLRLRMSDCGMQNVNQKTKKIWYYLFNSFAASLAW